MIFFFFTGSTNSKEIESPIKDDIENWPDPEFQVSKGRYSPAVKSLVDKTALAFEEDHPDMRIVIFNPSMILGNLLLIISLELSLLPPYVLIASLSH